MVLIGLTGLNRDSFLNFREERNAETETPALRTNALSVLRSSIETAVETLIGVDGQYPLRTHVTTSFSHGQNSMSWSCGQPGLKQIKYSNEVF